MRRRAFLAALTSGSVALAGCSSTGSDRTTTDRSTATTTTDGTTAGTPDRTTTTETPSPPEELGAATVVDLETLPLTYALTPTRYRSDDGAEVWLSFTRTATTDHPATVEAYLRNGNEFANTFRLEATPPFGHGRSRIPHPSGTPYPEGDRTYRSSLVMAPREGTDLATATPEVERDDDGAWRLAGEIHGEWFPENVRLEPGETISGEFAVVGRAEGAGTGRPTGVYEFRSYETDLRLTAWETDSPGPDRPSRFEGVTVPEIAPDGDSDVAWFHRADAGTTTYVHPSRERAELPAAVDFTFVNRGRETVGCGHWNLYKLSGGSWYHVGPWGHTSDCRQVAPGGAVNQTLEAYHHEAIESGAFGGFEFGHLGGGRYAMVSGYAADGGSTAALVELVAPSVAVVATDDATVTRSGSTVTVTTDPFREAADDERAELTATRSDGSTRTVIPEQVMRPRYRGLRNLVSQFGTGVETVVLNTSDRVATRLIAGNADGYEFSVGGEAYFVERTGSEE